MLNERPWKQLLRWVQKKRFMAYGTYFMTNGCPPDRVVVGGRLIAGVDGTELSTRLHQGFRKLVVILCHCVGWG